MMHLDLGTLRNEHFAPRVGEEFRLELDGEQHVVVTLTDSTEYTSAEVVHEFESGRRKRLPFRMSFRGPLDPQLVQRIYRLHNEHLGTLEVFLVPVARREDAMWYEAVFT